MMKAAKLIVLVASVLPVACAAAPAPTKISQDTPVEEIDNQHGLALGGYDPVAYFTEHKPTLGRPDIVFQWKGATYRFATQSDRELFEANPEHYAPQFGGYCAFAVSLGTTADGDPLQWTVDGDKLFVNNNPTAAKLWNQHRHRNIRQGVANWPLIPRQPVVAPSISTELPPQ
jgi:hypothetical protein